MSKLPMTPAGQLELLQELMKIGLFSPEEAFAFLENMTLEEYRLSKTKLGKLLAGKEE